MVVTNERLSIMKIMVLNMHKCGKSGSIVPSLVFSHFFCGLFGLFFLVGIFGLFYFLTWDNAPSMMIITLSTQNLEK